MRYVYTEQQHKARQVLNMSREKTHATHAKSSF
jgi:hypothetical protein